MRSRYFNKPEARKDFELTSAARVASGTGAAFATEDAVTLEATLAVTARAGTTPTLDVVLETSVDGTNWDQVGAFPQQTAVVAGRGKAFGPIGRQCRWKWTIGGSAGQSFTFAVTVKALRGK